MSPELLYPQNFGLEDSRPTKSSDCYALGMVIHEVLSGEVPFPRCGAFAVVAKVSRGERPRRPRGDVGKWFTNGVWRILERCWMSKRDDRPSIEDVLQVLQEASGSWTPLPPRIVESLPGPDSPVWSPSNPSAEESASEDELYSLSRATPSQPKGDTDGNNSYSGIVHVPEALFKIIFTQGHMHSTFFFLISQVPGLT